MQETDPDSGKRTVVHTIRIPEFLSSSLTREARDSGLTVNAFINQLLQRHVDWYAPATETGFISAHRDLLRAMVAKMGPEDLADVGKADMPNWIEQLAMSWYGRASPDAILKTLVRRFEGNQLVRFKLNLEGNSYRIMVNHDLGPNWSHIYETGLKEVVMKWVTPLCHSRIGSSMVAVTFRASPELVEAMKGPASSHQIHSRSHTRSASDWR